MVAVGKGISEIFVEELLILVYTEDPGRCCALSLLGADLVISPLNDRLILRTGNGYAVIYMNIIDRICDLAGSKGCTGLYSDALCCRIRSGEELPNISVDDVLAAIDDCDTAVCRSKCGVVSGEVGDADSAGRNACLCAVSLIIISIPIRDDCCLSIELVAVVLRQGDRTIIDVCYDFRNRLVTTGLAGCIHSVDIACRAICRIVGKKEGILISGLHRDKGGLLISCSREGRACVCLVDINDGGIAALEGLNFDSAVVSDNVAGIGTCGSLLSCIYRIVGNIVVCPADHGYRKGADRVFYGSGSCRELLGRIEIIGTCFELQGCGVAGEKGLQVLLCPVDLLNRLEVQAVLGILYALDRRDRKLVAVNGDSTVLLISGAIADMKVFYCRCYVLAVSVNAVLDLNGRAADDIKVVNIISVQRKGDVASCRSNCFNTLSTPLRAPAKTFREATGAKVTAMTAASATAPAFLRKVFFISSFSFRKTIIVLVLVLM